MDGYNAAYIIKKDNDRLSLNVYEEMKVILGHILYNNTADDRKYILQFEYLDSLNEKDIMELGKVNVTEQVYDNRNCYVLEGNDENKEKKLVIDKESMLILKYDKIYPSGSCLETKYEYEVREIQDEEIKMKIENIKEYQMSDEIRENIEKFF